MLASVVQYMGTLQAAFSMHTQMLYRVLRSPMSFFDTTPVGRVVNRFSKDIDVVDSTLPMTLRQWLTSFLQVSSECANGCKFSCGVGKFTQLID